MRRLIKFIACHLFAFATLMAVAQNPAPYFYSITNDDGLSQSMVTDIVKDFKGIMWFATRDGLNRHDGNSIRVFRTIPGDSASISSNDIECLLVDGDGYIWIGTRDGGISRLDPRVEKFDQPAAPLHLSESLLKADITSIAQDEKENIWAGTAAGGLILIDPHSFEVTDVFPVKIEANGLVNVYIRGIVPYKDDVWLATAAHGLIRYSPEDGIINHYFNQKTSTGYNFDSTNCIITDDRNQLWIGTAESFLFCFDPETEKTFHIRKLIDSFHNISAITDLHFQGDSLWITTTVGGLHLYHVKEDRHELFSLDHMENGINYNSLLSIYIDDAGIVWVGTNGKGLNYYHPGTNKFTVYSENAREQFKLDMQSVRAILEVENLLLVGGYNGFNRINMKTGNINHEMAIYPVYAFCRSRNRPDQIYVATEGISIFSYDISTRVSTGLALDCRISENEKLPLRFIYEMIHFKDDLYLIGCLHGMGIFNETSKKIMRFHTHDPADPQSINPGEVKSIFQDNSGRIWVGTTGGGMSEYNFEAGTFTRYIQTDDPGSISSNVVHAIQQDSNGSIWVGTNRGLNKFDPGSGNFKTYSASDGLPNDVVYGILEDRQGYLWISTNNGLSRFDPASESFTNFGINDGLPGSEFNTAAYYADPDHRCLYFGGVNGMVSFRPEQIEQNLPGPKPVFNRFFVFNDRVETDTILYYKNNLRLTSSDDFISFELTALNYLFPEENYFQYRIPEYSDEWINLGRNPVISLVDPDPGDYSISIRASVDQKNWSENPNSLKLTITPRFYETVYFRILIVALVSGILIGLFLIRIGLLKRQEKRLKELVDQQTSELRDINGQLLEEVQVRRQAEKLLREANSTKDKFFSIIAHDLRNPFSALLGFSELLEEQWQDYTDKEKKDMIGVIRENSENTYNLLLNLLDWSRIQKGTLKPSPRVFNLHTITSGVVSELHANAVMKEITIRNEVSRNLTLTADEFMLSTAVRNILSNAVKFTPRGGQIRINAMEEESTILCCIEDTGVGMDKQTREMLFSIKSTKSTEGTNGEVGTGLGLIVTWEFIRLMKGELWVESEPGKGSTFCLRLPKTKPDQQ